MDFWISLVLWVVVAALLLYGWFYNMGQYRETTKDVLVTVGSCVASLFALRAVLPGLAATLVAAAVVVAFILFAFLSPFSRKLPRYVCTAAGIVLLALLMYVCDKFIGLSSLMTCLVGAVLFCVFYGLTLYIYARRHGRKE